MNKFAQIDLSKYEKPSRFIRWNIGDNRIRVLTEPFLYSVVGKRTANGYVRHILSEDTEIPEFLSDVQPKLTYGFVVYSHDTGHFHVLETGITLGNALAELIKEKFPEEYKTVDIVVNAEGEKLKRKYKVSWAAESIKMPEGLSSRSPEYLYIKSYFQG